MSYSDNYPAGAANDPRAPYNQVEPEAVAFNVSATFTLEKTFELMTVQYEGGETDDEGYTEPYDTLGVNWKDEYKEQQYNPVELLEKLADIVEQNFDVIGNKLLLQHPAWRTGYLTTELRRYKGMIDCARGWKITEENYEEV
jgi:hypothetical protein